MNESKANSQIELKKLELDYKRYKFDILKWLIVAAGAVASFWVIDYGRLKLEEFRVQSQNERELLISYLKAMETPHPEIWKRKIQFLKEYSKYERIESFGQNQIEYINEFAELNTLYRETLKVASRLSLRKDPNQKERNKAWQRFEQLYWGELPFAGESPAVERQMVQFRRALEAAHQKQENDNKEWANVNQSLLMLAKAIKSSMPDQKIQPTQKNRS